MLMPEVCSFNLTAVKANCVIESTPKQATRTSRAMPPARLIAVLGPCCTSCGTYGERGMKIILILGLMLIVGCSKEPETVKFNGQDVFCTSKYAIVELKKAEAAKETDVMEGLLRSCRQPFQGLEGTLVTVSDGIAEVKVVQGSSTFSFYTPETAIDRSGYFREVFDRWLKERVGTLVLTVAFWAFIAVVAAGFFVAQLFRSFVARRKDRKMTRGE